MSNSIAILFLSKLNKSIKRSGVFLIITIISFHNLIAQQADFQFKRLSIKEGLSQSTVQGIVKDKRGFIWIGTRDGLNRYDGYEIKVFKNDTADINSIVNDKISDLLEDTHGNLWIGTSKGLDRFERETESFIHYPLGDSSLSIRDICQERTGKIWVSTERGIFLFNYKDGTFKNYRHNEKDSTSLITNNTGKVEEDDEGNLWISSPMGVDQLSFSTKTFTHYKHDPKNDKSIGSEYIRYIHKDNKGNIWVVCRDAGLSLFNKKDKSFIRFLHDTQNKNSLPHNDLITISDGPDGKLWIGTDKKGICTYDITTNTFTSFRYDSRDKTIRCFYKDNIGDFWIGTHEGGTLFLSKSANQISYYQADPFNTNSLSSNLVSSILEDYTGELWVGTDGGGINSIDRKKGVYTHYKMEINNSNSLSNDDNYAIEEINKDTLAFGNYKGGFMLFNKKTKKFTHYSLSELDEARGLPLTVNKIYKTRGDNICIATSIGLVVFNLKDKSFKSYIYTHRDYKATFAIHEDKAGNMWVGGDDGLFIFDSQFNQLGNYLIDITHNKNLTNNRIHSILEDKHGNIWVTSNGKGLCLFDKKSKTFTSFVEKDGLPHNIIYGILEDHEGNLWLSSNNGIAKFNIKTRKCKQYDIGDGDQSNEFRRGAYYKNTQGEMFFGGSNGFISFHPDSIKDNTYIPPIVFTDFQIFNKSVRLGKESPLKRAICETKEITLSYNQSVFTIAYSALSFTQAEKNQYVYKLEGFDKDWNYVGTQREATYTNLDPGTYVFRVKGSNNDDIWNKEGASITVIITPPYWETWWFRTLNILFVIGGATSFYLVRINTVKQQKEVLEKEVKERTMEVVMQKEEIKDSIRAAQTIQTSILPSEDLIKKHLPESFILYKPKDVVSGDFYWFDVKDDNILIAAVDCTGHGVSGAFMAITSYHLLNKANYTNKNAAASDILDMLNQSIIKELNQQGLDGQHGMDIALCIIDKDKKKLQYSGANNPLYIVRGKEIIKIKANKYAIGLTVSNKINKFSSQDIAIEKGDMVYIFSDGYADQIGGPDGEEKFMYPRFRELLLSINAESMEQQLQILNENLRNWQGQQDQLDDILVIGFRL